MAEEIVQDLYLKIAALDQDYRVDNPTAYLFRAGTHIWLNTLRGAGRAERRNGQWLESHHTHVAGDIVSEAPSAEDQLAARQQFDLIRRSLLDLPTKTQDIFRLHKIDGVSQADVALRLGISRSSVEKHMAAAIKYLTACLSHDHGP